MDAGVIRSVGPNTGYRYPGGTWEGMLTEALLGDNGQPVGSNLVRYAKARR